MQVILNANRKIEVPETDSAQGLLIRDLIETRNELMRNYSNPIEYRRLSQECRDLTEMLFVYYPCATSLQIHEMVGAFEKVN